MNTTTEEIKSNPIKKKTKTVKSPKMDWFRVEGKINENGKISEVKSIRFDYYKFSIFLMCLGFFRYEKDRYCFTVMVENRIVKPCTQIEVIDHVVDFIQNLDDDWIGDYSGKAFIHKERLLDKIYSGINTYFSDTVLNRCRPEKPLKFLEDTKDKAYFFFKNCAVEVSKDQIKTLKYSEIKEKHIWKDQILNRDFRTLSLKEFIDFPFFEFVKNISSNNKELNGTRQDAQRLESLLSIIGYNLHKYFEGKLKATIFTDSTLGEEANGRTGKTLLVKAIGKMLNVDREAKTYVELNGKNFRFHDPKRYQECELDTKLVHINDAMKNFDFELLFNDISEGIKAVQHYKSPFLVNAKIVISTNRTIKIHGSSAKDRSIEFEMSNHYGFRITPEKEFGHWFFRDWNKSMWLQFDNFMLYCVKFYLSNGLLSPNHINLNMRKLNEETRSEFVLFMGDYLEDNEPDGTGTYKGYYSKGKMYEDFLYMYPDFDRGAKKLPQRTFTNWCKLYAKYKDDYTEVVEGRSNGKSFIKFIEGNV